MTTDTSDPDNVHPARNPEGITHDMDGKAIFTARIHGTGKVTIPKNVRDLLDLREGDYVSCIAIGKLTKPREVIHDD